MTPPPPALPLAFTTEGSGPPLILIHGYAGHRGFWDPWMPALVHRNTCIRVDLPGFGEAPVPDEADWSPRGLARPVVELVRRLDLRDCTLVGHSLGGGVALLAALELLDRARAGEPARLARLVSLAGAAYPQAEPPFVRMARRSTLFGVGFTLLPKRWLVRTAMRAIVVQADAVTEERVERYARPMRDARRRRAFAEVARAIVPDDLEAVMARYPEIDVPTLCLWGRHDRVVPAAVGRRLAAELPRARLEFVEACGHQIVEEQPEASLARLIEFLDATPPGQESAGGPVPGAGSSDGGSNPRQRSTGIEG